jgi:glucuronosyltransferase
VSRIHRDQPLTPLEQAVFWTEYVIRHKGAPHMRSAVLDLSWYQYFLLDVIAVLVLALVSAAVVVFVTFRLIMKTIYGLRECNKIAGSKKNKYD